MDIYRLSFGFEDVYYASPLSPGLLSAERVPLVIIKETIIDTVICQWLENRGFSSEYGGCRGIPVAKARP